MNAEPAGELGYRLLPLQRLKRHLCLELSFARRRVDIAGLLLLEDQLPQNRSLRHCPIPGEQLNSAL